MKKWQDHNITVTYAHKHVIRLQKRFIKYLYE
jgi:hypothetical protein